MVASTLLLVVLIACTAALIDFALHGAVHAKPVYFSALIGLVVAPLVLYLFVGLVSQLDRSEEKLKALSIMDDLTDVYNRRYFIEQAEKEMAKAVRYGTVFSIMAVDIDHFKKINEDYGHFAGDAVLRAVSNTCMNNLRTMDIFARFGGEEFIFLIPESDKIDVPAFAEKVLHALEQTEVEYEKHTIRFTVSIGVKTFDKTILSLEGLLKAAEDALDEAKRRGRNCVVIYEGRNERKNTEYRSQNSE
ncbi:MAG TPA: diguanylate cyclase [Gammaproteobacteria bacterium]